MDINNTAFYLTTLTLVIASIFYYFFFFKKLRYWKERGVPYVQPSYFFGNLRDVIFFKTSISDFFRDLYFQTKEPFIGFYFLTRPALLIKDPKLVEAICIKDFHNFSSRPTRDTSEFYKTGGFALFNLKDTRWKYVRQHIAPVFSSGKLKQTVQIMDQTGDIFVQRLKEKQETEVLNIVTKYASDILSSAVFGIEGGHLKGHSPYQDSQGGVFVWTAFRFLSILQFYVLPRNILKVLRTTWFDPAAVKELSTIFWLALKQRKEGTKSQNANFLDLLMKLRDEQMPEKESDIANDLFLLQSIQLYAAGFETVSVAITFLLHQLALNPQYQETLRDEIQIALKKSDSLTCEVINSMQYLDMCVREITRLYPAMAYLDRMAKDDYKIPDSNVTIPAGTPVFISSYGMHYDENYFPEPQKFNPNRFSEENKNDLMKIAYAGFGLGPRSCVGERYGVLGMKVAIVKILSHFSVERCEDTCDEIKFMKTSLLLSPDHDLRLRFKPLDYKAE